MQYKIIILYLSSIDKSHAEMLVLLRNTSGYKLTITYYKELVINRILIVIYVVNFIFAIVVQGMRQLHVITLINANNNNLVVIKKQGYILLFHILM